MCDMAIPLIGESYRGVEGHIGYLLHQTWGTLRGAMHAILRPLGLTAVQYGVLSVLAREPGCSGADLARAINTTPQATNGVLATLEREQLIERHPHPTHGRILRITLTSEGQRRLDAANPAVRALEAEIERAFTPDEIATVKRWLVESAARLETIGRTGSVPKPPSRRPRAKHAPRLTQ
jgi:DNA-binding MarR family transcriptional regulator